MKQREYKLIMIIISLGILLFFEYIQNIFLAGWFGAVSFLAILDWIASFFHYELAFVKFEDIELKISELIRNER